ncbi:MAG: DUF11 domain-containing protein [Phycisphaerae bacterium]|nr:DUF11 domain-containing protein [Phycisphaerae bacterium]
MKAQFVLILVTASLFCSSAFSEFVPVRITDNPNIQIEPAIDGTRIVWQDNRHPSTTIPPKYQWDIYFRDYPGETEQRKTSWPSNQINPAISGDWIVWEDDTDTRNREIYALNLTGGVAANISSASGHQIKPSISNGRVVWEDYRNQTTTGADIYLYDLVAKTTTPLCTASGDQTMPSISGHRVVWLDGRGDSPQIYLYNLNLAQERAITTAFSAKGAPVIRGNKIVWYDFRSGNFDIFLYDLSTETETRITSNSAHQMYPAVSDVGIVWTDYRHDANGDLYFYEFATQREIPLIVDEYNQILPDISGNRIVWMDFRNDLGDIYLLEYSPPGGADLSILQTAWPAEVKVGDRIVYTLQVTNYGPLEATNVSIMDNLSPKVRLVSATSNKGTCFEFAGDIVGGVASLAANEGLKWTIVVEAIESGMIVNTATVEANEEDPIAINNSAATATRVSQYEQRSLGEGWYPQIRADASGFAHASFTRRGERRVERFGNDPMIASVICHHPDDIVYATNRSGRWISEIIYDGIGYSDPGNVVNPRSYRKEAVNSALALDVNGHAHIAYQVKKEVRTVFGETWDQFLQLWYTNNGSGTWSKPVMIAEVQTYIDGVQQYGFGTGSPLGMWAIDLDIDPAGHAHAMYVNTRGMAGMGDIVYLTNADGEWTATTVGRAYDYASLAVDHDGHAHICHYGWGTTPGGEYYEGLLYLTNASDGTWGTVQEVDPDWTGGQLEGMVCEIAIDSLNRPQISLVDGAGQPQQDYRHAVKIDGIWQLALVAPGSFQSGHNQIAIGPDNAAHILYPDPDTRDLMYANNVGGTWTRETVVPQGYSTYFMLFDLATDPTGGVHFIYHDRRSDDLTVTGRMGTDGDSDGVGDAFEQGPNGDDPAYDGNEDGIPDAQQDNVASMTTFAGQGYVTLACPEGVSLSNVQPQNNPSPEDAPTDQNFVYDFLGFMLLDLPVGGSTTVTLILPADAAPTSYYKYGPTPTQPWPHWYEFMFDGQTGAEINGNIITLHFVDGERGDNDLSANGVIVDPGAAATAIAECVVDLNDLVQLTDEWMLNWPAEWMTADLDTDGRVGIGDLAILAEYWMQPCPADWPWKE